MSKILLTHTRAEGNFYGGSVNFESPADVQVEINGLVPGYQVRVSHMSPPSLDPSVVSLFAADGVHPLPAAQMYSADVIDYTGHPVEYGPTSPVDVKVVLIQTQAPTPIPQFVLTCNGEQVYDSFA